MWLPSGDHAGASITPRYGFMGAAYANGIAYAIQAGIAYRYSQRFYPVAYEWSRLLRVVLSAALGWIAASALPPMHPVAGILARGSVVVLVMGGALWVGGFLRPEELAILERLGSPRAKRTAVVPPADTTEFAGEIVATDLPEPERDGVELPERSPIKEQVR